MGYPLAETGYALCVEDDPLVAKAVVAMLEVCGFDSVRHAATLAEAKACIDRAVPDFAILDLDLGAGLTSVPLVGHLQQRGVPIVIMSGYTGGDLPTEIDGIAFLPKPVRLPELQREVIRQATKKAGSGPA